MATCPACRSALSETFVFCPYCAAPLAAPTQRVGSRERRVVTSLFCDLVGFTAMTESADPEDVDAMLAMYFEAARARIEGHGGVVQKFIGDAVVGVFGVPVVHEDDPERAVRAGLRIVEDAERLRAVDGAPLRLRVGIDTGEALVRLDVAPGSGEAFLTGDATNTASRIQAVAPPMGVAVGMATYEATARVFEYEELETAMLKGKTNPVSVFHARAPLARLGADLVRTYSTAFVGRVEELELLQSVFDDVVAQRDVRLVMVTGEPGLGKSRIVAELMRYVDRSPGLVTWRQGRCLPYGEGITFWALGEIVRSHAGILDTDTGDVARAKLDAVLPAVEERDWMRQQLAPLAGIEAPPSGGKAERFTAWRRFVESIAASGPAVFVFEDLHWADAALLEFVSHLADHIEDVPLLVVGTARPELFEQHPGFAGGLDIGTHVRLESLSELETVQLVSTLLAIGELPAAVKEPFVERVGGNPLFVEELVRLLQDREALVSVGSSWELAEGAEELLPVSVQGLIAARLDLLEPELKELLADAAVVGKVFWEGAVAAIGGRSVRETRAMLRALAYKELIRPLRRSSFDGEAEFSFWHALTRDVAYSQLTRRARAARHVAAAEWIDAQSGERVGDLADVLAFHYNSALDLFCASGQSSDTQDLEARALRFTRLASRRAERLGALAAVVTYRERAVALTPPGHPERSATLNRLGLGLWGQRRLREAAAVLEEAIETARELGDLEGVVRGMTGLGSVLSSVGDPRSATLPREAMELSASLPASQATVGALNALTYLELVQGRPRHALDLATRAQADARTVRRATAEEDFNPVLLVASLFYRGAARFDLGDERGLDDMREALAVAQSEGLGQATATAFDNLADRLENLEGPAAALEVVREGLRFARPRGLDDTLASLWAKEADMLVATGALEEAAASLAESLQHVGLEEGVKDLVLLRTTETILRVLEGNTAKLGERVDWLETTCRDLVGELPVFVYGFDAVAVARVSLGEHARALALLREIETTPGAPGSPTLSGAIHSLTRTALAAGDLALAERLVSDTSVTNPRTEHATVTAQAELAEARGDLRAAVCGFVDAAGRWARFGSVLDQAFALLGQGRCLVALDDPAATGPLGEAQALFAGMGARPLVEECDALFAHATRTPS